MKIYVDNINLGSNSGPNSFGGQLLAELTNQQINVTLDANETYDICLSFIELNKSIYKNAKLIQRLDGIWFKPEDFEVKNKTLKETYYKAHGIIFQSEFDKYMIEKHFGKRPVPSCIIRNGTTIKSQAMTLPWLDDIKTRTDKIFVAASQWKNRPHKRLVDTIRFVSEYSAWTKEQCCLITMGTSGYIPPNAQKQYKNFKHIHLGNVPKEYVKIPYYYADWMLHLAYLDHCPNVVIDALSCKIPIVCSSEGGTKELVKNRGLIIQEEKYHFNLCDYTAPPHMLFNANHFNAIQQGVKITENDIQDIDIKCITQQYLDFFNRVKLS